MLLNEITDTQVATTLINPNDQQRRLDAVKPEAQLAREKGAQYATDRTSGDPLRQRIAQLRQQLAVLIQQAQEQQARYAKQQGQQPQQAQQAQQAQRPQGQQQQAANPQQAQPTTPGI